jgi:hypothetical protein
MPGRSPDGAVRVPTLRVVPDQDDGWNGRLDERAPAGQAERLPLRLVENGPPLLIAGADPVRRAALLNELMDTMPEGTAFAQASTLSEVLEHAPWSRMVILSGELDDAPASSLRSVLGQRHPRLPLVTLYPELPDAR